MKKIILIFLILLLVGLLVFVSAKLIGKGNELDITSISEEGSIDTVIIKNGEIKNEELIDNFLDKTIFSNNENQTINIIQDDTKIRLEYTSGEYAKALANSEDSENIIIPTGDGSTIDNKKIYGYYSLFVNEELKSEYPCISNSIKRVVENNNITLYFDAPLIEYTEIPIICTYSLESSNYTKKYDLTYVQRKDLGINDIYDNGDYMVKTFGGDVLITIESDMVYNLEDALKQNIITCEDILNQTKIDEKYGICQSDYYSDGGSTEFLYKDYTILKLYTLSGDNDLVIGMQGQIINSYNNNK